MHISSRDTSYESNNFVVADDKTKLAMENDNNSENNLICGRTMRQWSIIPWSLISSASLCAFWYVFFTKRQLLHNAIIQYYLPS